MPALLTTRQAAKRLTCTPYVVRELCQAGKLRAIKIKETSRARWRIDPEDLEAFIKARKEAIKKTTRR